MADAAERSRPIVASGSGLAVTQLPNGFAFRAVGSGNVCFAKITNTAVAKATSTTRPGKGTLQRYTSIDMTTTPATLANLTGVDEPCVNIFQDKMIAQNSTVAASKALGVWVVMVPDSCADLG